MLLDQINRKLAVMQAEVDAQVSKPKPARASKQQRDLAAHTSPSLDSAAQTTPAVDTLAPVVEQEKKSDSLIIPPEPEPTSDIMRLANKEESPIVIEDEEGNIPEGYVVYSEILHPKKHAVHLESIPAPARVPKRARKKDDSTKIVGVALPNELHQRLVAYLETHKGQPGAPTSLKELALRCIERGFSTQK